ncbi:MAG: hypothetical protein ABSD92_09175 [Candidatus Bathyarchaeia archaeon]|jgi:hypothetical protein
MSVEKINKIKEKAKSWAKSQSTEKLESIKKTSEKIVGNSFEEISQIEWTINAIDDELDRRRQEEVLKTKEEILSIFKMSTKR